MITIGVHFRGPELRSTGTGIALIKTVMTVAELCGAVVGGKDTDEVAGHGPKGRTFVLGSAPLVNAMFYVPGSLGDFEPFESPRPGKFSRKLQEVLVEVYVSPEQVASTDPAGFVIDSLRKCCAIASDVFKQKGAGPYDLTKANAIIDRVQETLRR